MTYLQELPDDRFARRAQMRRFRLPFMTVMAGACAALAVALGALNGYLESWVISHNATGTLEQVEFISSEIVRD